MKSNSLHVAIVGAGIIGLSIAYHLVKGGARVTVFDRDPEGDKTSYGNAGGIAVTEVVPASAPGTLWRVPGWMADPLGPLAIRPLHAVKLLPWLMRFAKASTVQESERISHALAAINLRVYDDLVPLLQDIGYSHHLHRAGALNLYETEAGYQRDAEEWACKRARGIEVHDITVAEAREMEPALGPLVKRVVFTPQWSHINDPKLLAHGIRDWLLNQGAVFRKKEVEDPAPSALSADRVVIAAGAWSARLARRAGDRALLESERGYNITFPSPSIHLTRELVFAERKFVAAPLSCGLRIGGAAEFGGLKAAPNYKRAQALVELARRYLPELRTEGGVSWAGHRPATPDSLPVISASNRHPHIFYAFGHGHLGLTQSATTGRLMSQLILGQRPELDMTPYQISRFD